MPVGRGISTQLIGGRVIAIARGCQQLTTRPLLEPQGLGGRIQSLRAFRRAESRSNGKIRGKPTITIGRK